jgi:DNA-binding NarL/FixJ family response regulator
MQALIDREAAPDRGPQTAARILVIESDPARSSRLTRILRAHVRADLEIVKSTSDALRSMIEHVPDLVLTSTFLPPAEESSLNAHLRQTPGAAHVQVITVPHFIDDDDDTPSGASARKVISFLTRRASLDAPACDPTTVIQDINAYLEHSRARRLAASADRQAATGLIAAPVKSLLTSDGALRQPFGPGHVDDRRRARRRCSGELPWLWAVKLPWGTEVKVVDISNRGVLVESPSKLTAGSTLDLQLVGQGTNLHVPARMLRSEVAGVDALGVKYRVAAAFSRNLEIPGLYPDYPTAALTPRSLADLLSRVMAEVDRCANPAAVRARFEKELRELVPLRDVQLRLTPVIASQDAESIYFTVPQGSGPSPILQATFDRDYRPSPMEFRLLKAAASLAAVVLEFAPLDSAGPSLPS